MNLRQPYEQLIADKLRQLRAPDANASWQQMKQLLDDDEDTKGGGGRRRPPGNNGLWRISILAIVLTASFWLYIEKKPSSDNSLSKNNKAVTPQADNRIVEGNKNISDNNKTAAIDNTTTLTNSNATNNSTAANNTTSSTSNANAADKSVAPALTKSNHNNIIKTSVDGNTDKNAAIPLATPGNAANSTVVAVKHGSEKISKGKTTDDNRNAGNGTATPNSFTATALTSPQKNKPNRSLSASNGTYDEIARGLAAGTTDEIDNDNINAGDFSANQQHNRTIKAGKGKSKHNNNIGENDIVFNNVDNDKITGNNSGAFNQTATSKEITWFERLTGLRIEEPVSSFNTSLAAGDSIAIHKDVSNLLNNETKKAIAKAQRDKEIARLDKQDKKFHLNLSNLFKPFSMRIDAEPWWAAGIALNAPITVNTQNRFNYSMNAKSGTLTDYIPSPYLQFHLNNYVYFQTELNFITPQYTPQLLVYRESNDISAQMAGTSQQKSIYVQKMYYFNWPVSLHYSPVSNLFFSGGIQFSSFQSGLATIEEKQYPTALGIDHSNSISSTTLKFKDDSIAAKIAPNEWRWQVGAEYYINRFSVGLRYNQSFKNAINTTVLPGMPPTVSRNQSLLFFVRYNLFESRQKNTVPKNQ